MSGEHQEGWRAPLRAPLIAAAATLTLLLGGIVVAGSLYRRTIELRTHAPVPALRDLPRPQLETAQSPPGQRRAVVRQPAAPAIARAMAETAAQGDALWQDGRR